MRGDRASDSRLLDAVVRLLGASADTALVVLSQAAAALVPHGEAMTVVDGRLARVSPELDDFVVTAADVVALAQRAEGFPAYGMLPATRDGRPSVVFVAANGRAAGAILVLTDATASTAAYRSVSLLWEVASTVLAELSPGLPTADDQSIDSEWRKQLRVVRNDAAATLRSILAPLRSKKLDDAAARQLALTLADQALTTVRSDALHLEYTAGEAFSRSADSLRPLVQNSDVELQLAPPDDSARVVPDLCVRTATIIARGVMLTMLEYTAPVRIRVGWSVTSERLTLNVRDDGDGAKFPREMVTYRVRERVAAMGGTFSVDAVAAWGTTVTAQIPLDATHVDRLTSADELASLTARERQVLDELVQGHSNRLVAEHLGLSEHTVKFHVHRVLHKLGASSRGEAAAVGRAARSPDPRT